MSILNVNQIQPVGSGQTVTINAANISAGSATLTAGTFSGNLSGNVTGTVNSSGVTTVAAGSTSAPSISPTGDSNTGIFFPSADTVCIGEGGSEVFRASSSGNIGINNTNPQSPLHISGNPGTLLRLDGGSGATGTRDIVITEFDTAAYGGIIRYDSVADLFTFGTLENSVVKSAINVNRASGIVTTPHQPSFLAYGNTDQNISSSNTYTKTTMWATAFNVGSHWSSNRFTAPVAGKYLFGLNLRVDSVNSDYSRVLISKNGSTNLNTNAHGITRYEAYAGYHTNALTVLFDLAVSDYVEVYAYCVSDSSFQVQSESQWWGYLVG